MSALSPAQFATTPIRTRSVANVDTLRLVSSQHWLRTEFDPATVDARIELRQRAREKQLIERELDSRGIGVPIERHPRPREDRR